MWVCTCMCMVHVDATRACACTCLCVHGACACARAFINDPAWQRLAEHGQPGSSSCRARNVTCGTRVCGQATMCSGEPGGPVCETSAATAARQACKREAVRRTLRRRRWSRRIAWSGRAARRRPSTTTLPLQRLTAWMHAAAGAAAAVNRRRGQPGCIGNRAWCYSIASATGVPTGHAPRASMSRQQPRHAKLRNRSFTPALRR